jgi:outer membrane protein TolC
MREQAIRMYEARKNEVLSQLRQQLASAEQSYRSARLYETTVLTQARLALESALASYRVNRVDFLTLLDNQMSVFSYEIGLASAVVNQNKALAEIEFITGQPIMR